MNLPRVWLFLLSTMLTGIFLTAIVVVVIYIRVEPQLPSIEVLRDVQLQEPLRIYSSDHRLLAEFGEKRRTPVSYEELPDTLIKAFLAAEDDHFFDHAGVDFPGLLRAAVELARTGKKRRGASTITMQVARNFFLSREKTYLRKLTEILLAFRIEESLTKEEILELYLNKIYLGHRAYGVQAAARVYYGTDIADLSLARMAMIAALPKAPSRVNPINDPDAALVRRNYILGRMHQLEYIDRPTYEQALAEGDDATLHKVPVEVDAPWVAEMVRREMVERYGEQAYTGGMEVVTTLDSGKQAAANHALQNGLIDYSRRHGYRGPEQQVDLAATDSEQWPALLEGYTKLGGLQPALVTGVEDKTATLLLKDAQGIVLDWDGMSWARSYRSTNSMGPAPSKAADILTVGDIVRLQHTADGGWMLAQLPVVEGAVVSLDPHDGAVLALVGGFDFNRSKFNRATQARRQPGSSFKPVVYSAALEKGYSPASIINDAPVVFDDPELEATWRPENYSGQFYGPTRLREALYRSRNLVSIRIMRDIGAAYVADYAQRFGFNPDELPHDLTLALGSATVTPLQMARAYAVLANGGYLIEPYFISTVRDADGNIIHQVNPLTVCAECAPENESLEDVPEVVADEMPETAMLEPEAVAGTAPDAEQETTLDGDAPAGATVVEVQEPRYAHRVLSRRNVWLMNSMMRDVIRRGTGQRARALGRLDIAGKTGTTNDQKDGWFSGFNHAAVATVWVGFDQVAPLGRGETGGRSALPVWIDYMREALAGVEERMPDPPDGLVTVRIDPANGLLARSDQQDAIFETLQEELVPTRTSNSGTLDAGGEAVTEQLF